MWHSIAKGFSTAFRTPRLVLLLWLWNLLLGLAAAMPARAWFGDQLDTATEAERMLARFNFGTFADLSKYQETAPFSLLVASAVGIGLLALVGNAFVNGGLVEVLGAPADTRPLMHRFFRGAGHFFWRFTRLNVFAFALGAIATGIAAGVLGAATAPFGDSEWEPAGTVWGLVTLLGSGLVGLWFVLALDFARLRLARDGSRRAFAAYAWGLGFVARHTLTTYGIAIVCLLGTVAALLAYVGHETVWTQSTWGAILVLLIVQQILMIVRTGLRVAQVGAEWAYFVETVPVSPPASVVPAPPAVTEPPAAAATTEAAPAEAGQAEAPATDSEAAPENTPRV